MPNNLWQPGQSGNPAGRLRGSRNKLSEEVICALLRDFRRHGEKAIAKVRQTQPGVYLKVLALLIPREHKVEHSNPLKDLTDEQLEAMIEYIETSLAAQAGRSVKLIEGTIEPTAVEVAPPALEPPKPKPGDARGGRRGPPEGAQAAQGAIACGDVTSRCGGSAALRRAASCRWQKTIGQPARTCRPPSSSVPPKVLGPVGRQFGIPDRVLNVLMPKVVLQGPRVVAIVGELEATGVAKHVWVDREWRLGGLPDALDEPVEADGADRPTAFGNEHVSLSRVIAA